MKLRVIRQAKDTLILCPNGSVIKADAEVLQRLLTDFKKAKTFKGEDGYWIQETSDMENVVGTTLAFVDDAAKLVIISDELFSFKQQTTYLSATEYAALHNKSRPSVKNMCAAGRIPGAYKTSSGWLIPADAPYPRDGRAGRTVKKA